MKLKDYFAMHKGAGVLATADADGMVNAAVYAKPHITEGGRAAFVMRERGTYRNICENPSATYLFMEAGVPYSGIRMHLQKTGEEEDEKLIAQMTRAWLTPEEDEALGPKHLVFFRIDKIRRLVGDDDPGLTWNLQ